MEWKFCVDGKETGWGWGEMEMKSAGMGVISDPIQVSTRG